MGAFIVLGALFYRVCLEVSAWLHVFVVFVGVFFVGVSVVVFFSLVVGVVVCFRLFRRLFWVGNGT